MAEEARDPSRPKSDVASADDAEASLRASNAETQDLRSSEVQTADLMPESGPTLDLSGSAVGRVPAPAPDPRDEQGKPFGRYRLLVELGRGGMGVVWKAWDRELRRLVALKQILSDGGLTVAQVERFQREARLAARLRHPGIVGVLDVGTEEGQPYFTTEYVEARSLEEAMKGEVPPRQAAEWMRQVAEALAYAHENGVVHRDVKPGNVLIDAEGKTWVMDFGLAKEVEIGEADASKGLRLTLSGALVGTPQYMSPEQATGDLARCGPASDQFSLGAVFYELLTRRVPFDADGLRHVLNSIAELDPVPVRRLAPKVDRDLETVCLKALEKDPARRYPSMRALAADLARWIEGEGIEARPVSIAGRIVRKARRHRWVVAPTAAALVLALVGAGLFVASTVRRGRELDAAILAGNAARARGDAPAARDAFREAVRLSPSDAAARAGLAWAEDAVARRAEADRLEHERVLAEKHAAEEALRKGGLVQNVLARWVLLADDLAAIDRAWYDSSREEVLRRRRAMEHWPAIEEFLAETPPDPTSQATAKAFAGWVRMISGNDDGEDWLDASRKLDPDLPYADLLEAFACLANYLTRMPIPNVQITPTGPVPGPMPEEREEARSLRKRMETHLASAAKARVWGQGMAEELRRVAEAVQALVAGRPEDAEKGLTSTLGSAAVRTFRNDLLMARAKMRYFLGKYGEALADLDLVRDARPEWVEVYYFSAVMCQGVGLAAMSAGGDWQTPYKKGIEELGHAIRLVPGLAEAFGTRATLRKALGDLDGAIEDLDRSVALLPGNFIALVNRGVAKQAKGDAAGALADYEAALAIAPNHPVILANRASARDSLGDRQGALEDYSDAIRLDPRMAQAWYNRGIVREELGELPEAEADLTEAIRRAPTFRGAYRVRARVREAQGEIAGAIGDLEEVLRLMPANDRDRGEVEASLRALRERR